MWNNVQLFAAIESAAAQATHVRVTQDDGSSAEFLLDSWTSYGYGGDTTYVFVLRGYDSPNGGYTRIPSITLVEPIS
jgi:hypothetical protein